MTIAGKPNVKHCPSNEKQERNYVLLFLSFQSDLNPERFASDARAIRRPILQFSSLNSTAVLGCLYCIAVILHLDSYIVPPSHPLCNTRKEGIIRRLLQYIFAEEVKKLVCSRKNAKHCGPFKIQGFRLNVVSSQMRLCITQQNFKKAFQYAQSPYSGCSLYSLELLTFQEWEVEP